MQFVWFNVPGPDNGLELQLSVRSVQRNFDGNAEIVVVGTKPPWYSGHFIPLAQNLKCREAMSRRPFRDTQFKLNHCLHSPEIADKFVWMMDDVYMMKRTSIEDLEVPRHDPWYRVNMKTVWHQLIRITFAELAKHGKSNLQYGTHLPHLFEKSKLSEMFAKYDYPRQLLLFEILYGNHVHNPAAAVPYTGFLRRLLARVPEKQLNEIDCNILNYQSRVWNSTMRDWLLEKFPE